MEKDAVALAVKPQSLAMPPHPPWHAPASPRLGHHGDILPAPAGTNGVILNYTGWIIDLLHMK